MRVGFIHPILLGLLQFYLMLQLTDNNVKGDSRDVIMMEALPPSPSGVTKATKTEKLPPTSSPPEVAPSSTETPPILRTQSNVKTTPTTLPVPTIAYFMFLKIRNYDDDNNTNPGPSKVPNNDKFNGFVLWISLLGVGCLLTGMIIASFVLYGFRRRLGCKCRVSCRGSTTIADDLEAQMQERQRSPTSGMENDPFRPNPDSRSEYTRLPTELVENFLIHGNLTSPYSSFRGLDSPWASQFHQLISKQYGGDVTNPHSDVIVSLPPDSFEHFPHRPFYVNVAIGGDDFNLDMGPSDVQLTPVVEVTSIGVQQFNKPVIIRIPHRACVNDSSQWQMTLYYTTSPLGHSTSWNRRSQSSDVSDVRFTYDKTYVYVETTVPGTFVCAGVGRKQATLCVCAVAYVNWQALSHHLQLSVYICDNYTDMHKYINDLESSRNGVRASHHQSLDVYNMKDWLIKLHSASSPVWPWAEVDDDYNQAISMNEIVRRPVGPSSVTFRLRCKDSNRPLEDFQATVTIGQVTKDPAQSNIYLVTRNLPLQEISGFSSGSMRRKSVHEPEDEGLF